MKQLKIIGILAIVAMITQARVANAASMIGYWETWNTLTIGQVSPNYDVIELAFATSTGTDDATIVWGQNAESDAQFRSDIAAKHAAGKKIILGIGGGGDATIHLNNSTDIASFVNSVEGIVSSYGLDGIDLDFESGEFQLNSGDNDITNPTTTNIKNAVTAMQQIGQHFGPNFIFSYAPGVPDVDALTHYGPDSSSGFNWGSYLPVIYAMRNYPQWVETQMYWDGGFNAPALDGKTYTEGVPDYPLATCEFIAHGYTMANGQQWPAMPGAAIFGVPIPYTDPNNANNDAADPQSYLSASQLLQAAQYMGSGTSFGGAYHLVGGPYPGFGGVATWDIDYDQNFEGTNIANTLHPYLASIGGSATEGPFGGTPAAVPGTVQAENYDTGGQGLGYNVSSINGSANSYRSDGVDLETTTDTGGGYDLGWSSAGQWFRYTVNVATAGPYTVSFRVANGTTANGTLHIQNSSGTNLTGSVTVAPTGGWQTWATVTATANLPAGKQTLTIFQDGGGYNINYVGFASSAPTEAPYGGTPAGIPGTVQAENYDTGGQNVAYNVTSINGTANSYRSDGVDLETTTDTGGGWNMGWTSGGQWFRYTVNVASAGTYNLTFRVANGTTAAGTVHIQNSAGTNLTGSVSIPATGGWQTWTIVNASATLPAGQQVLTVWQDTGGYNINYIGFAAVSQGISNGAHTLTPQCATATRLDDTGGSTANGNKLQIWAAAAGPNQTWTFTNIGGSNYTLQVNGAHCLDSTGATTPGTQATIWACGSGNANQSWTATPVSGGFTLKDANAGLCLDVSGGGSANGTAVLTYTCNGTSAQTWAVN